MSYEDPSTVQRAYEARMRAEYLDGLLDRLRATLGELTAKGYRPCWIEAGPEELVRLFEEGGDDAIRLDPDPALDLAWFEDWELRPSAAQGVFVYLEGEYEEMSRHVV